MMIIVMADIIGSSSMQGRQLMADFKKTVADINQLDSQYILSPLTITLGDEFQGVVRSISGAFRVLFDLETSLMALNKPFKLRYVIHEGEIQTKINKVKAHEMLGPGLTTARAELSTLKKARSRFKISLKDKQLAHRLNLAMSIYQGIVDNWTIAQQKVVRIFWEEDRDYKKVAKRLKKDPTVIWRRKKSLMIEEVNNLKTLVFLTLDTV